MPTKAERIDIVIATWDRLDLLKQTVGHIVARTRSPYRLYIIDDASGAETMTYVDELRRQGIVAGILRRKKRAGISANLRALLSITQSDPIVFTDDDVLCPDVDPDWLARESAAMAQYPQLGILSLNNPQASSDTRRITPGPHVTLYGAVGAVFAMIRRPVLKEVVVPDDVLKPMQHLCVEARKAGFDTGCLTDIYSQHIGIISMRTGREYAARLKQVYPTNSRTLEPPDAYKI